MKPPKYEAALAPKRSGLFKNVVCYTFIASLRKSITFNTFKSLDASNECRHLLITFALSLDPDQDQ